jgi:sulfur carrier protein ThiS
LVPAGTSAALLTSWPLGEPSVAVSGNGEPVGQVVKKPNGPCGNAPKFNE